MSDIDRLTVVVACLGLMLIARLPEENSSGWSFARLTLSLAMSVVLTLGVALPVFLILGWWPFS